jgi:bifunctional non-homologous end joining protein LigD
VRPTFVPPLIPSSTKAPPRGAEWIHEPKWDGFRFQVIKNGREVRLYSRNRSDYSEKLPRLAEWFAYLPTQAAILDGELCLLGADGKADFSTLMSQMRSSWPDEERLVFFAFDLLHQDGVDLQGLALSERKRDLDRLCRKSRVPFLRQVQTFPDGAVLLEHCEKFGLEGVVSKRLAAKYVSGPSRSWVKVKCERWKEANAYRAKLFE